MRRETAGHKPHSRAPVIAGSDPSALYAASQHPWRAAAALTGCQATTASTLRLGEKVTADELSREIAVTEADFAKRRAALEASAPALNADIEAHNATVESAQAELQRKAEFRATIIDTVCSEQSRI